MPLLAQEILSHEWLTMNNPRIFQQTCLAGCIAVALSAPYSASAAPMTTTSLLKQTEQLPAGFAEHFFDVPLAVRIELNGQLLGEGMITLSHDERVRLLEFTHSVDVQGEMLRRQELWGQILQQERKLGECSADCPEKLLAIHYSIENSQLSIVTADAEVIDGEAKYYLLPQESAPGLIVRNQLNLVNSGEGETSGNYWLNATASLGTWSMQSSWQMAKSSGYDDEMHYSMQDLYGQREYEGRFLRLGYFTPDSNNIGLQPMTLGGRPDTTLGVMLGSSDTLAIRNDRPSATPIYVTVNRPGMVEIYRNQQLINSQSVQPGLQTIDTRSLPGGIYPIEVRLVEDGDVTYRREETIYKPENWADPTNRWRYNLFAGKSSQLISNWDKREQGELNAGVLLNYLINPRLIGGLSAQQVQGNMQYGTTLDWRISDSLSFYNNLSWAENYGQAVDLQGIYSYGSGSIVLSHNQSWLDTRTRYGSYKGENRTSSANLHHRLSNKNSLTGRVSNNSGNSNGTGVDLGWQHNGELYGNSALWRVSLFDRPGSYSSGNGRNRGIDINLSWNLSTEKGRITTRLGSRTARDGGRDNNAAVGWQQDYDQGFVRNLNGTLTADRYGTGLDVGAGFQNSVLRGDAYAQKSSYSSGLSGGVNLESTVAMGRNKLAASGESHYSGAGMIIDVESDVPEVLLRADEHSGSSTPLRPGRNFIPVAPYKTGHIQYDVEKDDHAVTIKPQSTRYQLNRGGVEYRKIQVMKTVTVIGRVLDAQGEPIRGGQVINHASRSVTEHGGFFAVEMNASSPTLAIHHQNKQLCELTLDINAHPQENDALMVGDIHCVKS